MSSSVPAQHGDVVVVTQMYPTPPQGGSVGNPNHQHMIGLGAVQIMIGLMVFLFGVFAIVLSSNSITVISGVFAWATVQYIIAGSLTVAAGKSSNRCLMNTTVFFNITASLAAFSGVGLYAVDAALIHTETCHEHECDMYEKAMQGMYSVLTVFHFLEFFITIVAASLACKSSCNSGNQQPPVYIIQRDAPMAPQAPSSYSSAPATMVQLPQQMTIISNPANGQSFPGFTNPPAYTSEPAEEIKKS